jgi:hypothetical protein
MEQLRERGFEGECMAAMTELGVAIAQEARHPESDTIRCIAKVKRVQLAALAIEASERGLGSS